MGEKCCKGEKEYENENEIFSSRETRTEESPIKVRTKRKNILFSKKSLNKLNTDLKLLLTKKFSKIDSNIKFTEISQEKFDEILNKNIHYKRIINNLKEEINNILFEDKLKYENIVPIKITDTSGDIQYYQGSYNSEGKCSGPGIWYKNNNIYFGNFSNDEFYGKGLFINSKGDYYFGYWKHNKCNGKGNLVIDDIEVFQGDFKDNKKWGEGVENFKNCDVYYGHFYNGEKNGNGKYIFNDGNAYEGTFKNSKMEGDGKIKFNDGKKYIGEIKIGNINGKGELFYENGIKFKGEYFMNKKNGCGEYIWPDGKKFKGKWKNNIPEGQGTFEDKENKIIEIIKYKEGHIK